MRGCGNRGAAGSYLKQDYEMLAERARGLLSGEVSRPDEHETRRHTICCRNSQPGTNPSGPGVKTMTPVASEIVIADKINTVRRPMRSPSQPQKKAPGEAPIPEASRI